MNVYISKGTARGRACAPPSKSIAHRSLICAALSGGMSTVRGIAMSEDIMATIDCLTALGASLEYSDNSITVTKGISLRDVSDGTVLHCRESGSTLRFMLPLCMLCGAEITLTGSQRLMSRPLDVYRDICSERGISFVHGGAFVKVKGRLTSGRFDIAGNISSQFVSGLLFALPLTEGDSVIYLHGPVESRSYIDLTLDALKKSGINAYWRDECSIFVKGNSRYAAPDTTVEGDHSNAAFLSALNVLGGDVTVTGLDYDSLQGDRVYADHFNKILNGCPTICIGDCPDLGPILIALAATKNGCVLTGTRRLKIKESDRGAAMAEELKKFGAEVKVSDDTITVRGGLHAPDDKLYGHNDHRIVMALATLLTLFGGEISGAEAVSKSFPDYFEVLSSLGIEVKRYEA